MSSVTPRCVRAFCRSVLPRIMKRVDGGRILRSVESIVGTDRWNSFDRFHQTSETLAEAYRAAGAVADVYPVRTGGPIGSGRWIIQEAEDVRSATARVVRPVRRKLLDYRENPWHVIQWTASTPRGGLTGDLVVIDSADELAGLGRHALAGRIVLTRLDPRRKLPFHELARRGAVGVIADFPVPGHPGAVKWLKFGFGGIDINHAASRIVGLVISADQGRALRRLVATHGRVTLRLDVDVRRYVGTHEVTCGVVLGRDDPQDEVWALAHSSEPGAIDNASGVAVCVEIARVIEALAACGELPRPRRSIRLVSGYECHSFFNYLETVWRPQPPLAGVCIDSVGARPAVCDGRLGWHATSAMTAGFVDRVGASVLRATLRRARPGYRLALERFMSTPDTLIADPKYGFPCSYIETDQDRDGQYAAYHSSADVPRLLSRRGLAACAAAMAGHLYFLADAGTPEVTQLASSETAWALGQLCGGRRKVAAGRAEFVRERHRISLARLRRWLWGGDRAEVLAHLAACEREVCDAVRRVVRKPAARARRMPKGASRVPRRTAPLTVFPENTPSAVAEQIAGAKLPSWILYWADGRRSLAEIARLAAEDPGREVTLDQVTRFFEGCVRAGYVELVEPGRMISKARLVADLRAIGLRRGMMVMVHSSLSKIGPVAGGPETVVEALLTAIGRTGTLVMPSFNHHEAYVYNPLTTPTKNGAIPDAMWRRPDAVRSLQPSHPVAAIGPDAAALCAGHLEAGIWGADSPIGRLIRRGGYVLSIGVTQASSTAYHVAEVSMEGGCLAAFARPERVVTADGTVREVLGSAWRDGGCPVPPAKLDAALDRRGLRRHGKIGGADSTLVKAVDVWETRRRQLRRTCPACEIQPMSTFNTRYPDYLRRGG